MRDFPEIDVSRAEDISSLAKRVQGHTCTDSCSMDNKSDGCSQHFPRLPSMKTIICSKLDPGIEEEEADYLVLCAREIKISVRQTLEGLKVHGQLEFTTLLDVLLQSLGDLDSNDAQENGYYLLKNGVFPKCREVQDWIQYFTDEDASNPILLAVYHTAISIPTWKVDRVTVSQIVLKRSVNAAYVVDYNPFCLEAMRSNMSMALVTHTPEKVIEYITKSQNQNDSGIVSFLEQKAPSNCREQLVERAKCHRKVSLNEACYRIDNSLKLSETNIEVSFINIKFPEDRCSSFSRTVTGGFQLPGREGRFKKNLDILDKYSERLR